MAERKSKILDSDVQLYLLGGLTGDKNLRIREIEKMSFSELTSSADQRVKTTLAKLRKVDELFQSAADASYPMPANLQSEIDQILAQKSAGQKKNTATTFDKLAAYFTASNMWSLAGGGAVASFAMLAIIQIQPELLVNLDTNETREPIFRGASQGEVGKNSCGIIESLSWTVTDDFLLQIPVCKGDDEYIALRNGDEVSVGDEFGIFVLPIKNNSLSIRYETAAGDAVSIVENVQLKAGEMFELPGNSYSFSEPTGRDQFMFITKDASKISVNVTVK